MFHRSAKTNVVTIAFYLILPKKIIRYFSTYNFMLIFFRVYFTFRPTSIL